MKILKNELTYYFIFLLLVGALAGCSKDSKKETTGETNKESNKETKTTSGGLSAQGNEIFYTASTENGVKCSDCHSDGTNDSNPQTRYFSDVKGANKRPSTYNGMFKGEDVIKNAAGATRCWKEYMKHEEDALTQDQINALNAFYESLATTSTEIKYENSALPTRDKERVKKDQEEIAKMTGDLAKGEIIFKDACAGCHGNKYIKDVPKLFGGEYEGGIKGIVFNVRAGHDAMPFFRYDKLSNQELSDIAAFIMEKNK